MSDSAQPEAAAFRELELLVRHLGDELAGFRHRAIHAEARLRSLEAAAREVSGLPIERVMALEQENADLRARLEKAAERTRQLLDQVRFLRQQSGQEAER